MFLAVATPAAALSSLRLITLDLDDTLYPITPAVTAANDAVLEHCWYVGEARVGWVDYRRFMSNPI